MIIYQMSFTNQIIIPTVNSKTNLEDQNIFMPTPDIFTPQKNCLKDLPIAWKKSNSAFKKFKQKRDRKDKKAKAAKNQSEELEIQNSRQYVHLAKITRNQTEIKQCMATFNSCHQEYGYYDPNKCYLFDKKTIANASDCQAALHLKQEDAEKMQQEIQLNLSQQRQIVEEEVQSLAELIEPLSSDPFIIIKKEKKKIRKNPKGESKLRVKLFKNAKMISKGKDNCGFSQSSTSKRENINIDVGNGNQAQQSEAEQFDNEPQNVENSNELKPGKEIHSLEQIIMEAKIKCCELAVEDIQISSQRVRFQGEGKEKLL